AGEEIHDSDLICNCNGPLCDAEIVHLLGNDYRGLCRAKQGRCFKVFDEHHSYRMSVGCVDRKEIYPIPIFCLPHPKYHMSCCNYSFCDEDITMGVWLGAWKGDLVAVKIFSSRDEGAWSHEVETFQIHMLHHPNILQFYASDRKDTGSAMQLWLITEYHNHGSLYDYLSNTTITLMTLVRMIRGIANGLSYLHTELMGIQKKPAIAHRDIKSKNVLVKADLSCAIADLGLAVRYEAGHISLPNSNKCGTVRYLPPEILDEKVESTKFEFYRTADMYAIGLVLWEMARRTTCPAGPASPFAESLPYYDRVSRDPTIREMREVVVVQGIRPYESPHWQNDNILCDVARVMRECWSANPSSRFTSVASRANGIAGKIRFASRVVSVTLTRTTFDMINFN
ncbi:kinase domain protein, partial [Teladorsagia circumcincta]